MLFFAQTLFCSHTYTYIHLCLSAVAVFCTLEIGNTRYSKRCIGLECALDICMERAGDVHEIWCMEWMMILYLMSGARPCRSCGRWAYNAQAWRYSALDSQLVCSCFVHSKSHQFDFVSIVLGRAYYLVPCCSCGPWESAVRSVLGLIVIMDSPPDKSTLLPMSARNCAKIAYTCKSKSNASRSIHLSCLSRCS